MSERNTRPGCFLTALPLIGLLVVLSWVTL